MLWFYVLRLPPHQRAVNFVTHIPNENIRVLRRVWGVFTQYGERIPAVYRRNSNSIFGSGHQSQGASSGTDPGVVQMRSVGPRAHSTGKHDTVVDVAGSGRATSEAESGEKAFADPETPKPRSKITLLTLLLGNRQEEAKWVTTTTEGSKFHQRYGLLFEEYRGPATGRRDATLEIDPATGWVDRGKLVALEERPLWTLPLPKLENNRLRLRSTKVCRHHLQLMSKLLDVIKLILVGCIIAGVGNTVDNIASIIALIALSLTLTLLLRISNPFLSRFNMSMLLMSEVADLIVYACALVLILGPENDEDTDRGIGTVMLLSEALVLLVQMMEYAALGIGTGLAGYEKWKSSNQHKFIDLVHTLMMQNKHYLAKKYADRWMVRTFSRGLHGRVPDRHELRWREAVKIYLLYGWSGVCWFAQESVNIWNDGIEMQEEHARGIAEKTGSERVT